MEENNHKCEMHILEIILPVIFDRSKYMKMSIIQIILNSREISLVISSIVAKSFLLWEYVNFS